MTHKLKVYTVYNVNTLRIKYSGSKNNSKVDVYMYLHPKYLCVLHGLSLKTNIIKELW